MKVEFTPGTGAKPFDQRREEIDAQREAKGKMPITDVEFLSVAYDPTDPTVKDLQEKMKKVRSSMPELTLETPSDEPPSPSTLKEIQRKKDIFVMMHVRPPTRGKLNLYPQQTVGELVGAMEATQWAKQMAVMFLTRYMRTADALLRQIVKNTDKIILEVIMMYNSLPIVHVYPTKSDSWTEFQPSIRKKQKERYVRSNTVETQSEKAVEVHKSVEVDGAVN
ncbi:hypothetical protein POM88_029013 [Heracleum sosnowskyi]|uniref:Uncharacterized protein n=1 Tax=Heracleum sosnowskyi TaxID=360622 RepID=A0AAD8HVE7_9APIA|nr:hypothetical protein POM88_029013 [Heracleum sosnowskyi]